MKRKDHHKGAYSDNKFGSLNKTVGFLKAKKMMP